MLLAPNHRRACDKPPRQTLEDSVSEIEHSLRSLKFKGSTAEAGNEPPKRSSFGNVAASCQPAKRASIRFWQAHLKPAAPHGQRLAIAYDKACSHGPAELESVPVAIPAAARYTVPAAADTTCGMTLLAAFHAFLCRISYRQQQIMLGVQPSHLLMPQASTTLDPSASTPHLVPLACPAIGPTDTITSHAHKLHSLLLDLAPHASTSLPDICTAAGVTPAPGSTPQQALFRAAVVCAPDAAAGRAAAAGLDAALLLLPGPKPGSRHVLQASLLASRGLFSREGAGLMAAHFEVFLSEVVKDHNASSNASDGSSSSSSCDGEPCLVPMLNAPLMDAEESRLLLQGPAAAAAVVPGGGAAPLVHEAVARHAKARPDAACLVHEGRVFTYSEVEAASSSIATCLAGPAGVQPGATVALLLGRGPLLVAALLGVLKAGAAYLALDGSNKSHMQMMLEDGCVQVVITQPDLQRLLPASIPLHTLLLHPDKAAQAAECGSLLGPACLGAAGSTAAAWEVEEMDSWISSSLVAAEPACVLYGAAGCSKGQPNGMLVSHAGLAAYAASFIAHFGITAADVFVQAAPAHTAASIDEMWCCLAAGGALVLAPPELHKDANAFMQLIARYRVTTVAAAPSVLHQVAKRSMALYPAAAASGSGPCSSLLRVLCSEEPLTPSKAAAISMAMPRAALHYVFRASEACPGIASCLVAAPASPAGAPPAASPPHTGLIIGSPLGCSIKPYVLDSLHRPQPIGVPGELFISGGAAPCGALRPGLPGACFAAKPFHDGPGSSSSGSSSMLATGCVVRWLPGAAGAGGVGPLELIGHLDEGGKLKLITTEAQSAKE
uniref:AMP-dependent synthetase/ligase domain-containing protein n=1 Tax=Tetradesmus obliquus TaxID=3088 RepID=A0A383WJK3_TETOB|eukprot:jgi/Sobl393_1/13205/SZX68782.1